MNRAPAAAAALILALSVPLLAQLSDAARAGAQARRAAERLQALRSEADRLAGEARTLLGDLRGLEVKRQIATEELRRVEADASAVAADLTSLDREVQRIESEDRRQVPGLRRRLVDLYKLGQGRYARLLLSTSDLRRIGQASRTVAMLAKSDRDRVEARRRRLEELRAARVTLGERDTQLATLRSAARRAEASASIAVEERNALLRQIDARRDLTAQLAGELQAAYERLQRTLDPLAGGSAAATLPLRPFRGDLDWPAAGPVRRRFGGAAAQAPTSGGIEIASAEGAAVHAVHDGTVAFADTFAGFGNLVILEHDPRNFTLYGHLRDIEVARGARVGRGDVVGSAGVTPIGRPGVYFEVRIDGRPVDPLQWLRKR